MRPEFEVAAVYLQPIDMEPPGMMRPAEESDVHIEADIKALKSQQERLCRRRLGGLSQDHLRTDQGTAKPRPSRATRCRWWPATARITATTSSSQGPGKYKLKFNISPPGSDAHGSHFGRHVDKETGVGPWFKPFTVEYEFTYAGIRQEGLLLSRSI